MVMVIVENVTVMALQDVIGDITPSVDPSTIRERVLSWCLANDAAYHRGEASPTSAAMTALRQGKRVAVLAEVF